MAKIWWEPYRGQPNPIGWEVGGPPPSEGRTHAPTLESRRVLFVRVAQFTFVFHTLAQLQACLEFYQRKLQPSSRSAARAQAVASGEVAWRLEVERWYERLPLYLREESKRVQVVAALEDALDQAVAEGFE